jgi:Flp pilus assembly protein TadG
MASIRTHLRSMILCRRGVAAVEFAMVLPVFLALVFGIVTYGVWLSAVHGVQQLAAEAARTAVAGLSTAERASLAQGYVTGNVGSYPLIVASKVAVSATDSGSSVFTVTVSYDASQMFIYALPARASAGIDHRALCCDSAWRLLWERRMRS